MNAPWRCVQLALPLVALLAIAAPAFAQDEGQEYQIQGVVVDSAGVSLRNAMVVALTVPDSVLAKYALTDGDGRFTLRDLPPAGYILQVTLIGYQTLRRDLQVTDSDIDAGTVHLSVMAVEMDSLVVSVEQVPFVNRRDTLSYNVLAFETPPNSMVEDLLRRLPGIEVEEDRVDYGSGGGGSECSRGREGVLRYRSDHCNAQPSRRRDQAGRCLRQAVRHGRVHRHPGW